MLGSSKWHALRTNSLNIFSEAIMRIPDPILFNVMEWLLEKGMAMPDGRAFILKLAHEIKSHWHSLHPNVRRRFVNNLFGNVMLFSGDKHKAVIKKLGDWPAIMVVSPTMRCNLACKGCYSANYNREDAISTERFDRLLTECEELGIYFVVVSGGEPYLRRDLLDMFEKHHDIEFMTYTNGTIISKKHLAPRLAELGNVIPCISVEGFEEETDARRGKGVYKHVMNAMDELREAGVIFGFSATPMRHNNDLLVSDEFIDYYISKGAMIGWYFSYMPVGRDPNLDLMPTPEQRLYRMHRIREIRSTKPIVAADFWADGELSGGCLSGGRVYFHVNASGGVEPCVFQQFSVDNILEKPLIETLNSPYFRNMREQIAKFDNPLSPCPVIDHPEVLRDSVRRFHAKPAQPGADRLLDEDIAKGLDKYAADLKKVMDPEFAKRAANFKWSYTQRGGAPGTAYFNNKKDEKATSQKEKKAAASTGK